jgi:hypothetical protein
MAVMEDDETIVPLVPNFPIGEYYLANDDKGRARVFAREFRLTVRQLVRKFGRKNGNGRITDWSNFSQYVKNLWDSGQARHVGRRRARRARERGLQPARSRERSTSASPTATTRSAASSGGQSERERLALLEERGFDEFPILAGRWE